MLKNFRCYQQAKCLFNETGHRDLDSESVIRSLMSEIRMLIDNKELVDYADKLAAGIWRLCQNPDS